MENMLRELINRLDLMQETMAIMQRDMSVMQQNMVINQDLEKVNNKLFEMGNEIKPTINALLDARQGSSDNQELKVSLQRMEKKLENTILMTNLHSAVINLTETINNKVK